MHRSNFFESLENRRLLSVSIESVTASPSPVARTEKVTITANNVAATSDDKVNAVSFFIDVDSNGTFDKGTDLVIGTDFNGKNGYSLTKTVPAKVKGQAFPLGTLTIGAIARGKHGVLSTAAETTVTIVDEPPTIKKLTAPKNVKAGKKFVTTAVEAKDKDGKVQSIAFTLLDGNNADVSSGHLSALGSSIRAEKVDTTGLAPGTYTLSAVATDNDGTTSTAVTKTFTVT